MGRVWRETSGDSETDPLKILAFGGWEEKIETSADLEEGSERWKRIFRRIS